MSEVSTGTWTGDPTGFTYQWYVCDEHGNCVPVDGATTQYAPPVPLAPGSTLRCSVAPRFGSDVAHTDEA